MSALECPNCGKHFEQPARGRPKRFCSDTCRVTDWKLRKWKQQRAAETSTVPAPTRAREATESDLFIGW